jgi:hypothetical protein
VQPWQMTTVWACEKTVVMVKQPGHLTSMKKERGAGTRVCQTCQYGRRRRFDRYRGVERTLSLCFLASAAGAGFRRSIARTWRNPVSDSSQYVHSTAVKKMAAVQRAVRAFRHPKAMKSQLARKTTQTLIHFPPFTRCSPSIAPCSKKWQDSVAYHLD